MRSRSRSRARAARRRTTWCASPTLARSRSPWTSSDERPADALVPTGESIMTIGRRIVTWLMLCLMVVLVLPPPATAQDTPKGFKPEELDQLVAPIALHPDALLAQVLMASTYPLEVVQAARFVTENATLKGDQLNEALKQQPWDDSVKSLTTFPTVLAMMSEKLDWLQKLGDAFLAQQQDLMAAVQRLRARAQTQGRSEERRVGKECRSRWSPYH